MIYSSVSIDLVIARIIRNTRLEDTTFIHDMVEWIPEAMGYMHSDLELKYDFYDVDINFHKGKLPCGLISILAVEWQGQRLNHNEGIGFRQFKMPEGGDAFMSTIHRQDQTDYTGPGNYIWKSDLESIMSCGINTNATYHLEMDYITTSMCDTKVRVHFLSRPLDARGLPLIPDNENYKEALYWYCRAKMNGAGYKDSAYTERDMMERFEKYAARAIGEIRYPTVDVMQNRIATLTRFIPPSNYWEGFFGNTTNEPFYNS